jgi:hypothetical protein
LLDLKSTAAGAQMTQAKAMLERREGALPREALWRSDGARYESIDAFVEAGGLKLHQHETGPSAQDSWGRDDYEATLEIAREDVARLALALLAAGFGDRPDALTQLRLFCAHEGIPHNFAVWT